MKFSFLILSFTLIYSFNLFAECSVEEATKAVKHACKLYNEKGEEAFKELGTYRFCGDKNNYVWFQKLETPDKVFLTYHPVSPGLVGRNMVDPAKMPKENVRKLFADLDSTLRKSTKKEAAKVEYVWAKQGEEPSKKISMMIKCTDTIGAGAGFWP